MAIQLNPTVNDAYESLTLAQLRQRVFDACGFITPLLGTAASTKRTLKDLRTDVRTRLGVAIQNTPVPDTLLNIRTSMMGLLGLAVPNTVATDTLVNIRTAVLNMLGFAAIAASPPPGVAAMVNSFINEAQQSLFRALELDKGVTSVPAILVADGDTTVLDKNVILQMSLGAAKAHYKQDDAPAYMEQTKKYLADYVARQPVALKNTLNAYINDAQQDLFRDLELDSGTAIAPPLLVNDGDISVLDASAISNNAMESATTRYGLASLQKMYADQNLKYLADRAKRGPPNIDNQIISALQDAQRVISRRIEVQYFSTSDLPSTLAPFAADTDLTSFDAQPVFLLALGNMKLDLKQDSAKQTLEEYEEYMAQLIRRQPPDAVTVVNRYLKQAQGQLYRMYNVFRMERWFTWTLAAGQRFYGIQGDDNSGTVAPVGVTATIGSSNTAGLMSASRVAYMAAALQNGTVLVAGGTNSAGGQLATAEIFNPATGAFSLTGSLSQARYSAGIVTLQNGNVLITGGFNGDKLATSELYVGNGTFVVTGSMSYGRYSATLTLLQNGKVLVCGGYSTPGGPIQQAEIYDPTTGFFSYIGTMVVARAEHRAVLLPSGKVLITGGIGAGSAPVATAELFDPIALTFTATGNMTAVRSAHSATVLPNGNVLVAGGQGAVFSYVNTADIYSTALGTFSSTGVMAHTRGNFAYTLLNNGNVLVAGDGGSGTFAEIYTPSAGTFANAGAMTTASDFSTAIVLPNSQVLIAGGSNSGAIINGGLATAMLYNPTANTFSTTGSLTQGTPYYRVAALTAGGSTLASLPEASVSAVPANTGVIVSWTLIASANITGYAIYGRATGAEQLIATVGATVNTYTDLGTIAPNGALPTINQATPVGSLDPRNITYVGASSGDNNWRPLTNGVPPELYNNSATGVPQYYEIRQAIEIWPTPADSTWLLRIKGYFPPLPFSVDTDSTTIDSSAVYLRALADTCLHYKELNHKAAATEKELENYIGRLVAGSHDTRRYIPNGGLLYREPPRPVYVP